MMNTVFLESSIGIQARCRELLTDLMLCAMWIVQKSKFASNHGHMPRKVVPDNFVRLNSQSQSFQKYANGSWQHGYQVICVQASAKRSVLGIIFSELFLDQKLLLDKDVHIECKRVEYRINSRSSRINYHSSLIVCSKLFLFEFKCFHIRTDLVKPGRMSVSLIIIQFSENMSSYMFICVFFPSFP